MNKLIIYFSLMLSASSLCGQDFDLRDIRKDFNKGVKDEDLCENYYEQLKKNAKSPTEKGYQAAFQMFMAKHTSNPIKKMSYFNGGKKLLEAQIKANPKNTELRFIRLSIQYYTPSFLNYDDDIEGDKEFMLDNLYLMKDEEVKQIIFKYLKGADMYTVAELALLGR